jgi:hypothetical protein
VIKQNTRIFPFTDKIMYKLIDDSKFSNKEKLVLKKLWSNYSKGREIRKRETIEQTFKKCKEELNPFQIKVVHYSLNLLFKKGFVD